MDKINFITFLQNTNYFSLSIATEIASLFNHKIISKNQFQLVEGKICDEYFYLESGYMRSFAHDTEGNEVTTNFSLPGQMILEVSSFFNRTRAKENIQALTNCEGWYISYTQLNELFTHCRNSGNMGDLYW